MNLIYYDEQNIILCNAHNIFSFFKCDGSAIINHSDEKKKSILKTCNFDASNDYYGWRLKVCSKEIKYRNAV